MMRNVLVVLAMIAISSTASAQAVPAGTTFYYQLDGVINTGRAATVYDIDMANNTAALIGSLKQAGHKVLCYFSGGTKEDYRSDVGGLPASVIGNAVGGYPDEHWLDIRAQVVRNLMVSRMQAAKLKGCTGVDPDEVAGYAEDTGFPLTKQDQITYNTFLADQAHQRGMIIALKYSPGLVNDLVKTFDLSIEEQCFEYKECPSYSPFVSAGKAVMAVEYGVFSQTKCDKAATLGFMLGFYGSALNGRKYLPCQ
jgi:hypothetical protein